MRFTCTIPSYHALSFSIVTCTFPCVGEVHIKCVLLVLYFKGSWVIGASHASHQKLFGTSPLVCTAECCDGNLHYLQVSNLYCYIARLSLNKMSTVIGWFLVTCLWSNSNVSRPGYNCAVVALTPSLFAFAVWLFKGKSSYVTKHLMYVPSGN